ncbi:hypothetical protein D029_4641A, partial [Vibrio parahaemolyticus 970107]
MFISLVDISIPFSF